MAKKKGATLSDLNEFLKKDPNSLADVEKLSGQHIDDSPSAELSVDEICSMIRQLSTRGGESEIQTLLRVILKTLEEKTEESPADILLMNTALYLLHAEKTGERLKTLNA